MLSNFRAISTLCVALLRQEIHLCVVCTSTIQCDGSVQSLANGIRLFLLHQSRGPKLENTFSLSSSMPCVFFFSLLVFSRERGGGEKAWWLPPKGAREKRRIRIFFHSLPQPTSSSSSFPPRDGVVLCAQKKANRPTTFFSPCHVDGMLLRQVCGSGRERRVDGETERKFVKWVPLSPHPSFRIAGS